MVDDKTARLQSEINRLATALNAEPVQIGVLLDNDDLNIFTGRRRKVSLQLLGARQAELQPRRRDRRRSLLVRRGHNLQHRRFILCPIQPPKRGLPRPDVGQTI